MDNRIIKSKEDNRYPEVQTNKTETERFDRKSSGSPGWLMKDER